MNISITLSAANLGTEATVADFDAWHSYVCEHIDAAVGFEVHEVEQAAFESGDADHVSGATDEQREAVRAWLSNEGWEAFCADVSAWPRADMSNHPKAI